MHISYLLYYSHLFYFYLPFPRSSAIIIIITLTTLLHFYHRHNCSSITSVLDISFQSIIFKLFRSHHNPSICCFLFIICFSFQYISFHVTTFQLLPFLVTWFVYSFHVVFRGQISSLILLTCAIIQFWTA